MGRKITGKTKFSIEEHGWPDARFVRAERIEDIRSDFEKERGIILPGAAQWDAFGEISALRVWLREYTVTATDDRSYWVQFKFYPGYITDLASVPRVLRGLIDNDDPDLILAALPHDFNFSTHFLSFTESNALLAAMARAAGVSSWRASLAHFAVGSPVGWHRWKLNGRRRDLWTRATAEALDSSGRAMPRIVLPPAPALVSL
jgi:hypothetical protein